jgi:hypothetical protein
MADLDKTPGIKLSNGVYYADFGFGERVCEDQEWAAQVYRQQNLCKHGYGQDRHPLCFRFDTRKHHAECECPGCRPYNWHIRWLPRIGRFLRWLFLIVAALVAVGLFLWALIRGVRWFWEHPLW